MIIPVLAGLASHGTYAGSGDEPHYLAITHSLAFDLDLDLSNNYGPAEPLIGEGHLEPEMHVRRGLGGVLRPVHDIGMPLLFAPYVRVARPLAAWLSVTVPASLMRRLHLNPSVLYRHVVSAAMMVLAGLLALVLFDVFVAVGLSERASFWTTLLIALSPPLLIFSILFFTELVSALLCLVLFRMLVIENRDRPAWQWALAGLGTGFLVLVHVRNISLAMTLGGLATLRLLRRGERVQLVVYASGMGAMLALRSLVIHEFWGTWFTTPIANVGAWKGVTALMTIAAGRLAGLFLDQEYGLLPYAPIFLLVTFGFAQLAKKQPQLAWSVAMVVGAYVISLVLPITNAVGWTGGWSPSARFLVPIVPLLAIGVAAGVRTAPRVLIILLVAMQLGIDAYVWQHPKVLWSNGRGRAAACDTLGLTVCAFLPSFVKVP